jgi:hypothetical protein
MMTFALVVATWYAGYTGDVYCRDATTRELQAAGMPWVAVDVRWYETGRVRCGDLLEVTFPGRTLRAYALDAGPLSQYQVQGLGTIGVDVPAHLWPVKGRAAVVGVRNLTAECRRRFVQ